MELTKAKPNTNGNRTVLKFRKQQKLRYFNKSKSANNITQFSNMSYSDRDRKAAKQKRQYLPKVCNN